MREKLIRVFVVSLILFALIQRAYAAEEPLLSRFLGSPLLALTAIIVIDVIAFLYRKIKK